MKNYLSPALVLLMLYACGSSSSPEKEKDDSLQYYPPTPAALSKSEFRNLYNQVKLFYDTTLQISGFSGGMLVAKKGAVLFEKYTGFTGSNGKDSITANTVFHIASTSKTFTGMAVLKLVQEGKLSLDDSLAKFFPGFPFRGITVKMLLNHRSGLSNYVYYIPESKWNKKIFVTNKDVLKTLSTLKPKPNFPAGTHFSYSNTNYVLLAMIVEQVSGLSFPAYMKTNFFDPLQMNNSFVFTIADTQKVSLSYTGNGGAWKNDFLDATYGDKNIYTTPRDLLKWSEALSGGQLFTTAITDSAWKGYSFEKPSVHNYGLGWRLILLPNGKKVVYHFGRWHGFNAAFARLADEDVTIIALGNKFNRRIYDVHYLYNIFGDYMQEKEVTEDKEAVIGEKNEVFRKTASPSKTSKKDKRKKA